jgi:ribonuclease T2
VRPAESRLAAAAGLALALATMPAAAAPPAYVLAVNWQPAFCEGFAQLPECTSQTPDRFDAAHLSLHGLWPQPRETAHCAVDPAVIALDKPATWDQLPAVSLSPSLRAELDEVMPGTRSALDRHEWIKHGTCYGNAQEEYFAESLSLLRQLNASAVRAVLAGRIGGEITADQLAAAFDASFGPGAGARVAMDCREDGGRRLVVELKLNLAGEITAASRLGDLLLAAEPATPGCRSGQIDPVGTDD